MRRLGISTLVAVLALAACVATVLAQSGPEFKLGFKALADQVPDVVGQPLENEHWGANGDSLQQTSNGLMAWRKADNWTAFTNGSQAWINGPAGVQSRPNDQRFAWEAAEPPAQAQPVSAQPAGPTPSPTATPALPAALPTIELKGKGAVATQRFDLQEGLKIVHLTHNGKRNFIVQLMDGSGETTGYLANEIGAFDGRVAEGVRKPGPYLLNVNADGDWTVSIEQPRPAAGANLPQTFRGKGQTVTPFFSLQPGLVVANMQHNGKRNFIVQLIGTDGQTADYLSNQIGSWSGEKAFGVKSDGYSGAKPGLYLLEVKADGEWTVSLQYR